MSREQNTWKKISKRMLWLTPALAVSAAAALLLFTMAHSAQAQTTSSSTLQTEIQLSYSLLNLLPQPIIDPTTDPPGNFTNVIPSQFDPGKTNLVQASWLSGIGCPTMATTATPNTSFTGVGGFATFTDGACPFGDPHDQRNLGLLLAKTGPTITNFASATAELINVKGITLTDLGYDIRKPGVDTHLGAMGSHCGAGAPRFNVTTSTGFFFIGCSSPPPDTELPGDGWIRLRWGSPAPLMGFCFAPSPTLTCPLNFDVVPVTGTVQRIVIIFDEAQDAFGTPDEFGAAILDNIDVNGTLVGRGPVTAN
jgi:hypothetical protein